ncbi:MAG: zinc metalloprotease HtpX [Armatimonadota bacterium]|nr:zinc metalloprotease HtpX [Armatimonadota bacterium]
MNTTKTVALMAALTALIVLVGNVAGGRVGMMYAFVIAVVMNFGSYWFSDKIVLSMYGAKPIGEADAPELYRTVNRLTREAGIPMPKLYSIPTDTPNAFATGRNPSHAAVAVTEGILRSLKPDELEGVIAHELSHVKNRDILIGTIAATMAGVIMMVASMARWAAMFGGMRSDDDDRGGLPGIIGLLFAMIVAPIAALGIQMWISRTREYEADHSGALISGRPLSLANALIKLENDATAVPMQASQATAHMFIVNPLTAQSFAGLFRTHPPTAERVAKLRAFAESRGVTTGY